MAKKNADTRIDYDVAAETLASAFDLAEHEFREGKDSGGSPLLKAAVNRLFDSSTQAFREALVGCCLARISDPGINIRLPYIKQGEGAYNGRDLDEIVVNPFLKDREVPSTKGPYLSAIRRNFRFEADAQSAEGVRDREALNAMLTFIDALIIADEDEAKRQLKILMRGFVELREKSKITLSRINRVSMDQYSVLLDGLLSTPSGGLLPVLLSVATFSSIKAVYDLPWEIDFQGINVADAASGVGGDINIKRNGVPIISVEVTERPIDKSRVRSTFTTKIAPHALDDYLFFYSRAEPEDAARDAAKAYFAQGHEITFVSLKDWIMTTLTTLGSRGRAVFTDEIIKLLDLPDTPAAIKVAWNERVRSLVGV